MALTSFIEHYLDPHSKDLIGETCKCVGVTGVLSTPQPNFKIVYETFKVNIV